jgi:hypothetical protein
MSVQERTRRVGDTREALSAYIKAYNEAGVLTVEDLTGSAVTFTLINLADGTTKVSGAAATVDDATTGKVSYDFVAADVDTAGKFAASFIVTTSAETSHFPVGQAELIIFIDSDTQTGLQAYEAAIAAA